MRPFLLSIVLAALATNSGFAKDGHPHSHAQHGVGVTGAHTGASGKGASGSGANGPAPSKANMPIDAGEIVAPPVLPPRGLTQQQIRIINPSAKNLGNSSGSLAGATTIAAPTARNAIGQPIASAKNFPNAQPLLSAPQKSGAVSPLIVQDGPVAAPGWSGVPRVNVASSRGSVNGATVIRPANGPSVIGGPAATRYGINGTMVQNKH